MKISTMLLPTGEFIAIVSEAPDNTAEWATDFKRHTGAAAVLVTTEPVQVENAPVDEKAVRVDPPIVIEEPRPEGVYHTGGIIWDPKPYEPSFRKVHIPRAKTPFSDESFSVTFTAEGDNNLLQTLLGDAEFSPAGLVKEGPKTTVSESELIGVPFTPTERRARGFITDGIGVTSIVEPVDISSFSGDHNSVLVSTDPDAERVVGRSPYFGPENHEFDADDLVISDPEALLPDPFPPGTQVAITGLSYGGMNVIGQVGTVLEPSEFLPEDHLYVGGLTYRGFEDCRYFVHKSNVEPVPIDIHEAVTKAKAAVDADWGFKQHPLDRMMADLLEDINVVRSVN